MKESDSSAEIYWLGCVCGGWIAYAVYLHARLHATLNLAASLSALTLCSAACVWVRHVLLFAQGLHRRRAGSASDRYIAWKESLYSAASAGGRTGWGAATQEKWKRQRARERGLKWFYNRNALRHRDRKPPLARARDTHNGCVSACVCACAYIWVVCCCEKRERAHQTLSAWMQKPQARRRVKLNRCSWGAGAHDAPLRENPLLHRRRLRACFRSQDMCWEKRFLLLLIWCNRRY